MVEPGQRAIVTQYGTLGVSGYVEQVTVRNLFHTICPVTVTPTRPTDVEE